MNEPIINIERGGHLITIDRRDGYLRVNCNGASHVQFSETAMGEVKALKHAIDFVVRLESDALKYPKEKKKD